MGTTSPKKRPKKKTPRPPVAPPLPWSATAFRPVVVHVRLTEEEGKQAKERAARASLTLSELVRVCLGKPGQP